MKKYKKKINLTRQYLLGAAYRYLERYATTEANLNSVLRRKVERILTDQKDTEDRENTEELKSETRDWINEIVEGCVKKNLVNDRLYAESRVRSFISSGNSIANIENKLRAKGVSSEIIAEIIEKIKKETPRINLISAIKYAKRRRFGPFRIREKQENTMQKEQASMARAGFSYVETMNVLKASVEELEDILYEN